MIKYSSIFITITIYFDCAVTFTTDTDVSNSITDDNNDIDPVPMTEQIMQHNISIVDIPDVDDDVIPSPEPNWDAKEVIKDVAYFIRAHKFQVASLL